MKRWSWLILILVILAGLFLCPFTFIAISMFGFPTPIQGWVDRRAMQRHFNLPRGLELISYEGYPSTVGFGQREGLEISAVYQLTDAQAESFTRQALTNGWESLPIPKQLHAKIQNLGIVIPLQTQTGNYICKTAGDNILHTTRTQPCDSVEHLPDVILGLLDSSTKKLYLVISSGY